MSRTVQEREAIRPQTELILVAAILLLALFLRACGLTTQPLSMDEVIELSIANQPVEQIIHEPDGFPPLFHLLLKPVESLCDDLHDCRWLSVAFGLIAVAAIWRLGRILGGASVGLAAALLLSCSPLHVYFSQEIRAYSLYFTLSVVCLWQFIAALETDRWRNWIGFSVTCLAAVYTHYYAGLLAGMLGLGFLVRCFQVGPSWKGLVTFTITAVGCLPAARLMQGDHSFQAEGCLQTPFNLSNWAYTGYAYLAGFSLGPSLAKMHTSDLQTVAFQALPWAVALAIPAFLLLWLGWQRLANSRYRWAILLLALAAVPTMGLIGQSIGVGYKVRYVVWPLAAVTVLMAAGVTSPRWSNLARAACVGLLLVQGWSLYQRAAIPQYANEDMRSVAEHLQAGRVDTLGPASHGPWPVFVVSDYMVGPAQYYLNDRLLTDSASNEVGSIPSWRVYELPQSDEARASVQNAAQADAIVESISLLAPKGQYWLIYTRAYHGDPHGLLLQRLKDEGLQPVKSFPGVELYQRTLPGRH